MGITSREYLRLGACALASAAPPREPLRATASLRFKDMTKNLSFVQRLMIP